MECDKKMNSGHFATIIEYNKATDIVVQFDDGSERTTRWSEFKNGSVAHPSRAHVMDKISRVGEKHKISNGMMATIIQYRSSNDIDVQFDDGVILRGTKYHDLKCGRVAHPTKRPIQTMSLQEFAIGFYLKKYGFKKANQGDLKDRGFGRKELDFYHEEKQIAIEYDGEIHETERSVQKDLAKKKDCKKIGIKLYRLRASNLHKLNDGISIDYVLNKNKKITDKLTDCGEELKSILNQNDINFEQDDIDFYRDADKIIQEYQSIYVDFYKNQHIGETRFSKAANMYMTIVEYYGTHNMVVEFENGARRSDVCYSHFNRENVSHPSVLPKGKAQNRLGETRLMNCNMNATIIKYRNSKDIDVQFADGKIRLNVKYECFKRGKIRHPDIKYGNTMIYKKIKSQKEIKGDFHI